ncbi:DUF317 domain-containing protein [Streptomyces chromofuscus]|uniref:DUF317 domain-containing protein n=1 Tax=Streptomyces chromofuscus TaxID=42881 RepID=UPI0019A9600A|nr:DUF317 domain-containing protein [Streptomyces chromofuscus]GGS92768.1 hypothetical protein GCM10010254_10870 [Streptomyces chromofuscus]
MSSALWLLDAPGKAHSPDAMCHIELRLLDHRDTPSWHIETREHGHGHPVGPRIWHAWFDSRTPSRLVTAFVTALTDTGPLQRGMYDRTAHYSAVQEPSPLTPQQVVAAHTTRLRRPARTGTRRSPPSAAGHHHSPGITTDDRDRPRPALT